jgi:hypothetical protein
LKSRAARSHSLPSSTALLPDETVRSRGVSRLLTTTRLVYVSGEGGSVKTTVAGVLGLLAAQRGRRTVICELAGADQLARNFAAPTPLADPRGSPTASGR